jgi:hypothetical protein
MPSGPRLQPSVQRDTALAALDAALDAPPEFGENMVAVAGTGGIRTSGAVDSGGCNLARSLCGRGVRTTRASVVLRRHGDAIDLTSFSVMLPRTWR